MERKNSKRAKVAKASRVRKRQKLGFNGEDISSHKTAQRPGKLVNVDEISWKEVALPDRLEDAEGFFGLEEVDDIEVVRDGNVIQYRVAGHRELGEHSDDPSQPSAQHGTGDEDYSEWEGFGEEERADVTRNITAKTESEVLKESRQADKKKKKKKKNEGKNLSNVAVQVNSFDVLEESENESTDISAWRSLQLSGGILSALSELGFSKPTPIQAAAIPEVIKGSDVIGKASTGSGKTLAFAIPIVETFLETNETHSSAKNSQQTKDPLALILSPTRELAHQLSTHINDLCSKLPVESPQIATLTGGLSIQKQQRLLARADIVIGTPGRLWEVMSSTAGALQSLKQVKFLVVDEADRLLSEGHFKEVEQILDGLDREEVASNGPTSEDEAQSPSAYSRQTLVFSATFQKDLQRKLAGKRKSPVSASVSKEEQMSYLLQKLNFHSKDPKFIDVDPASHLARNLRSGLLECDALEKDLFLYAVLLHHLQSRSLIFTNSISAVRRLTPFLQNLNITAHPLHSEMAQKARLRSIERFSSPSSQGSVLVATDVAARGLDIPSVELILHYHVPRTADAYVHRSGRTARAEASGTSIMLCAPEEVQPVRRLVGQVYESSPSSSTDLNTLSMDRTLVSRLKPRVSLSQRLVSASLSSEKKNSEHNWLVKAAEELGVDYDSDEFAESSSSGKKKKVREKAAGASKEELRAWRAELKALLDKKVNLGVSERYLFAGGVDVEELLREQEAGDAGAPKGVFLGGGGGITGWSN